jgi:hypothetical protein
VSGGPAPSTDWVVTADQVLTWIWMLVVVGVVIFWTITLVDGAAKLLARVFRRERS